MTLKSINPANMKLVAEIEELSSEAVTTKITEAQIAFETWRQTDFATRSKLLLKVAAGLRANKDKYAAVITSEVGKTLVASLGEIEKCATCCEFYANNAEEFLSPKDIATDASESFVRFDPLGVVLAVMPWNFPFWQVIRFAAPAIMAGNVGLLKHASNVQLSAQALEDVFVEAGLPAGVFLNLAIGSAKVEAVIRDPRVKAVTLTGSEYAGSQVAKTAGEEIKKTVLELGGSDPFIVLSDADLDKAAAAAVAGRMQMNAGQSCIAAKRFIVHESIAEAFTEKLKDELAKLVVGDPVKPDTHVGPLANEQMVKDIERQVDDSVKAGAKIVAGGKRGDSNGCYYLPTILTNVTKGMPVYDEEVFGPAMPVITFKDEQQAVVIANDSPYGLGATIFTKDIAQAKRLAAQIESGSVFINNQVKSDSRLPFGGVKKSGYGRELSYFGIREFVNVKTIWIA
ncbi:MAG TPA: NAD-dependent succinate-semialdehyde dehydrogenase [Patescibacteria group bacterium]|nr:NAD-dependent succinate-semialdehyde dehydrogenase [Patescibacteria group bacterium]